MTPFPGEDPPPVKNAVLALLECEGMTPYIRMTGEDQEVSSFTGSGPPEIGTGWTFNDPDAGATGH